MRIEIIPPRFLSIHDIHLLNELVHATGECYSLHIELLDVSTEEEPRYNIEIKNNGNHYIEMEFLMLCEMFGVLYSDIQKAIKNHQTLLIYYHND